MNTNSSRGNTVTMKQAIGGFKREIASNVARATVTAVQPLQHVPKPKWGTSKFSKPKFSRFRAVVYYKNAQYPAKYPSWDYTKQFKDGVEFKIYSEEEGYNKLITMCKKIAPDAYNRIDIYVNMTADLRVETHNYNEIVCKIKAGKIVELCMLLRYRPDGKLDALKTRRDTALAVADNLILTQK